MNTTTHLARHILQFQPNKDAARLCFYHYLIHHCAPDTPLSPALIENFCRRALTYSHWQKERYSLCQELQFILQHYNETFLLNWNLKDITFPDRWQIIAVENSIDTIYLLEKWVDKNFPEGSKKRIFYTTKGTFLILVQKTDGEVTVVEATHKMLLYKGDLQPLCTDLQLQYTENLELKNDVPQHLAIDDNSTARFIVRGSSLVGHALRGYLFQKQQVMQGEINQFPALFYPLKQLEQHFIDRKSDPTYQELIQVLEKSLDLLKLNHPEASSFARAALDRGKASLENIFINDNMIQILVQQLERRIGEQISSFQLR